MRGHVRKRGEPGSWEYIVDIGLAAAQACQSCGKGFWVERRPRENCPRCGGKLTETEERRRETKSGFATQEECQAAMNKLLVAVEQHDYTAPTRASVKDYLKKEWLPAVKATIRPSTHNSDVQHVECHIVPHVGSVKLQKLSGSQVNALYAKLTETGRKDGKTGLSPLWHTIAMTGMRRGEVVDLRSSDVDLEAGRLAVRRALIPSGRDVVVSEPKTIKGRPSSPSTWAPSRS
jgi:integrase